MLSDYDASASAHQVKLGVVLYFGSGTLELCKCVTVTDLLEFFAIHSFVELAIVLFLRCLTFVIKLLS